MAPELAQAVRRQSLAPLAPAVGVPAFAQRFSGRNGRPAGGWNSRKRGPTRSNQQRFFRLVFRRCARCNNARGRTVLARYRPDGRRWNRATGRRCDRRPHRWRRLNWRTGRSRLSGSRFAGRRFDGQRQFCGRKRRHRRSEFRRFFHHQFQERRLNLRHHRLRRLVFANTKARKFIDYFLRRQHHHCRIGRLHRV